MCALTLVLLAGAWAADRVVFEEGTAEAATAQVAAAASVDPATLSPVRFSELVAGRLPVGLGGARVLPCTDVPTGAQTVRDAVARAEAALAYMEYPKARTDLGAAASALACLSEPADPALTARLWYIRGIVAFGEDDPAAAQEHFLRARVFDPAFAWDPTFAPAARAVFDAAGIELKGATPVWLEVIPAPPPGALHVDGRAVSAVEGRLALPSGPHLVQIGVAAVTTLSVELKPGADAVLVVPASLSPDALAWVADPARREALSSVLVATVQRDATVYVAREAGVWRVHAGRDDWETLATSELPAIADTVRTVAPPRARRDTRKTGRALLASGGIALIGGIATSSVAFAVGETARTDARDAAHYDDYTRIEERYHAAETTLLVGEVLAGAGLATAGIGLVLAW